MSTIFVSKNSSESSSKMTLKSQKLLAGALALVLAAGMVSPAFALVIDNFEEGPVHVIDAPGGGATSENDAGLNTANTIGGDRDTTSESGGPLETEGQTVIVGPNTYMSFSAQALTTGVYMLIYDGDGSGLGGVDLTADGGDRIVIDFIDADFGADVTVLLTDTNDNTLELTKMSAAGPQTLEFPFADMTGTGDASDVKIIKITVDSGSVTMADYTIDIIGVPQRQVGGTVGSMDSVTLLVAGAQSNMGLWSLALVGAVVSGGAIIYKTKSKKTEQ